MEPTAALLLLMLLSSVSSESITCEPKEVSEDDHRDVMRVEPGMSPGCWSNFSVNGFEVHILDILTHSSLLKLNLAVANPAHLIINLHSPVSIFVEHPEKIKLYFKNTSSVTLYGNDKFQEEIKINDEDILKWTKKKFGGLTSFTTAEDILEITFTGKRAVTNLTECTPKKRFYPKEYLLEMKFQPPPPFKFCSVEHKTSMKELHIVNIPDTVQVQEISVNLISEHPATLFLRGPPGTVWNIETTNHISLISNNQLFMEDFQMTIPPTVHNVSDGQKDVQDFALKKTSKTLFTSYTEMTRNTSAIRLVIRTKSQQKTSSATKSTPSPGSVIDDTVILDLYDSPEYSSRINPTAKVQSESTIYAEVSSRANGEIVQSIRVTKCSVLSRGSCNMLLDMPFQLVQCPQNVCPGRTRFSFSFQQLQEQPSTTWDLECTVQFCALNNRDARCEDESTVRGHLDVVKKNLPFKSCLNFALSTVLGVAFGGFLIGLLLMGALWFIKVRTGKGASFTARHIAGCPGSLAKRQPMCGNSLPSQDSSASPSMGSTQSTPSSSMA